ncbi:MULTISPECIES: hypothetical protein [unclassified Crossiella]|uniref:hypothetical protein n=1 Tax=unclassified Crossiella TaxID=2620835 RepID=UPI001FFF256C|nr:MULTISPECIES: hypothetical protein [unclassified Crossiella]MCK2240670.1 hypothetical protein [Crossiella sp. S99.2]MCK2252879.1 hypothetical protein [Crossiella sp. S99.1]
MTDTPGSENTRSVPLTPDVTITVQVTNGVPTLMITTVELELAFHPLDATTITRVDLDKAAILHEATQVYFDACARHLAVRESFGDWPGQDTPIPPIG